MEFKKVLKRARPSNDLTDQDLQEILDAIEQNGPMTESEIDSLIEQLNDTEEE